MSHADKSDLTLAKELNQFYLRFDSKDFSDELSVFRAASVSSQFQLDEITVWCTFEKINVRKGHVPYGISGRLLKFCVPFFNDILTYIFQWFLSLNKVPSLWKESIIVPVAKVSSPKTLNYHPNDYRQKTIGIALNLLYHLYQARATLVKGHFVEPSPSSSCRV